jgi:hydroxyacylglutathione hydrolase
MLKVKSFQFSPIQENTYVLYNEQNQCAIIDPGCYYQNEVEELKRFIHQNKLTPILLLNTHCHLDHVFGNKAIAEAYTLTLHLHKNEQQVLEFAPTSGLMYNLPFDNYTGDFIFLEHGDTVKIGSDELNVLLTPGHSPGSISFYNANDGFVISGDVLFKNSVGRSDLPGGNHETLIKSIQQHILTLPPQTIVYSGHGPKTTVADEMANNPYLN